MVFNFRSRDQQLRGSFLGCFAVGVDLELPAGLALARLLHCEITPSPCTVLVRRRSLCTGWMCALRRCFFPARWQHRLIPSTSVSGTRHSSSEEVASLSTLWKARYGLVVVLATHTCPRGSRGQRSHCRWGAWKTLKEQEQFPSLSLCSRYCCCCNDTWAHAPFTRNETIQVAWKQGIPPPTVHRLGPQVPKSKTSAYSFRGF